MPLSTLSEAIDGLLATEPKCFSDPESIVALTKELSRLESYAAAATEAFERSEAWADDGAKGAVPWLARRCRMPKSEARRRIRLGRVMLTMPLAAEAFGRGEIGSAQVSALGSVRTPVTEEALQRDEEMLVEHARRLRFEDFCRVLRYWSQQADPDGVETSAAARHEQRSFALSSSIDGMWFGTLQLDTLPGEIVASELKRLEEELLEADRREAEARLGREPLFGDLKRTPTQRRADALVEMATRSKMALAEGERPAPLVTVMVGYETLKGRILELAQGQVVTPGSLLPYLDEAIIERAVFTPRGRVEVSARARFFSGATRRAIELRDRRCTHPYCDTPGSQCEVDHIVPYSQGGPTTQDNGRLLCSYHNKLRNRDPNDTAGRPPPD